MSAAATIVQARAAWPDADTIPDDELTTLLETSWETRCLSFIPADQLVTDADPPAPVDPTTVPGWIRANILDARELWSAARREGDLIGTDQYALTVKPLSLSVQSLLRPRRGAPMVG